MEKRPLHILIAEDDAGDGRLIMEAFKSWAEPVRLTMAESLSQARASLASHTYDLMIVDTHLIGGSGLELLPPTLSDRSLPIIVITDREDVQTAVEVMRRGALDYVLKSPDVIAGLPGRAERALKEWGYIAQWRMTQARLARAKDVAEGVSRAKDEFIANMSHEIRTPLNGIIGITNLLLESPHDEAQDRYLTILKHLSENLIFLVNNILDFSKIESGAMTLEASNFHISLVLEHVVRQFSLEAQKKGLDLSMQIDPAVPEMMCGDPGRLQQILTNLIANAVKFTETGSVTLTCRPEAGGGMLRFVVADTGIGIEPQRLDTIFESFTQADGSFTRRFGGVGLGLAICKRLSQLMGGRIWAESAPGTGSTFSFTIPMRAPVPASPDAGAMRHPPDAPAPTTAAHPLKVLVVEDDSINQIVFVNTLKLRGMETAVADNGRIALELFKQGGFDLIVMDILMPEMDGIQATKAIRDWEKSNGLDRTPILALTAYAMEGDRERCLAAGMDDYLSKPFHPYQLLQAITALVPSASAVEPDTPPPGEPPPAAAEASAPAQPSGRNDPIELLAAFREAVRMRDDGAAERAGMALKAAAVRVNLPALKDDAFRAVLAVRRGDYAAAEPLLAKLAASCSRISGS